MNKGLDKISNFLMIARETRETTRGNVNETSMIVISNYIKHFPSRYCPVEFEQRRSRDSNELRDKKEAIGIRAE